MKTNNKSRLGIIIVAHGLTDNMPALFDSLKTAKLPGDKIVLVDNHSLQKTAELASSKKVVDKIIISKNSGFASACNLAANAIADSVDLFLFLNPDCVPKLGAIQKLRDASSNKWGAWMGLLVLSDNKVNSAGNIVHITGISWCGDYSGSPKDHTKELTINVLSGGCLVIKKNTWFEVGGFWDKYFLYYEDADLSFRLKNSGVTIGIVPSAQIVHDYDFQKSNQKWFYLERNRYLFITRLWPITLIILFFPLFILTECMLWLTSIKQKRFILRVKAVLSAISSLPEAMSQRRIIRNQSKLSDIEFLNLLTAQVKTVLLPGIVRSDLANSFFTAYYKTVRRIISTIS